MIWGWTLKHFLRVIKNEYTLSSKVVKGKIISTKMICFSALRFNLSISRAYAKSLVDGYRGNWWWLWTIPRKCTPSSCQDWITSLSELVSGSYEFASVAASVSKWKQLTTLPLPPMIPPDSGSRKATVSSICCHVFALIRKWRIPASYLNCFSACTGSCPYPSFCLDQMAETRLLRPSDHPGADLAWSCPKSIHAGNWPLKQVGMYSFHSTHLHCEEQPPAYCPTSQSTHGCWQSLVMCLWL